MNKKTGLIAILVLVILGAAATVYAFNSNPNQIGDKSTKLSLSNNNNNAWLHVNLQIQYTPDNGEKKTVYLDNIVKPGEKLTIDLSKALGYGNKKLPVGETRILSYGGLYNTNGQGNSNLGMTVRAYSGQQPSASDPTDTIGYPNVPIAKLPSSLNQFWATSRYWVNNNPTNVNSLKNGNCEPIFAESIVTTNHNGECKITKCKCPELCRSIAQLC